MDIKFSKDTGDSPKQAAGGDKGRQNVLLIVLLILVGGFGYVYFFTGMIKPQEEQKPVEAPAPQVVKKALPPREGTPSPAAAPGAKQAPASAAKPEPAKAAQAVPAPAPVATVVPKPKEEPKKPEPAKPVVKQAAVEKPAQKPVAAKVVEKQQAQPEKKQPAVAQKKAASAVPAEKNTVAAKKPSAKPEKKGAGESGEAMGGRWTVVVGNYLLEDALAADLVRVRKAGFDAAVQQGGRRKSPMNRLLLAEYNDRTTARAELDKLKRYTSDAFIIEQGGKYAVYAGSYLLDARAKSEKERLVAVGFTLSLKRVEVAIPSKLLTAGTFNDKKSADGVVKKLKEAGLKVSLSRQ
jgi:cell division protein FtsN